MIELDPPQKKLSGFFFNLRIKEYGFFLLLMLAYKLKVVFT